MSEQRSPSPPSPNAEENDQDFPINDPRPEEYSSEEDVDESFVYDEATFKKQMKECLSDVDYEGSFATYMHSNTYINPGLHITKFGYVGLPLSQRDAEAIARICKQSPSGKGSETLIDTSVRKTWELDNTEFDCQNPAWPAYLDSIAKQAIEDLGVRVPAEAKLYKMFLYDEGAFSGPDTECEPAPGVFGTLVICLPSEHKGGEVYLVHGKEKTSLSTADHSRFDLTILAWYSDVEHEVRPVKSGYRLVLTYNLVQDPNSTRQAASNIDESHARMAALLRAWKNDFPSFNQLLFPLDHKYKGIRPCLSNLKGSDSAKGRYLEYLCSKHDFFWFLGKLIRTEELECEGGEVAVVHMDLEDIVIPTGGSILSRIEVSECQVLADNLYPPDRRADREFTGGRDTGHDEPCYEYHNTVFVMMRKTDFLSKVFGQNQYNLVPDSLSSCFELIAHDRNCCPNPESLASHNDAFGKILARAIGYLSRNQVAPYFHGTSATAKSGDMVKLSERLFEFGSKNGLGDLIRHQLQEAITKNPSLSSSTAMIWIVARQAAKDAATGLTDAWDKWLSRTFKHATFGEMVSKQRVFKSLEGVMSPSVLSSFKTWVAGYFEEMMLAIQSYTPTDIKSLVVVIPTIPLDCYTLIVLRNLLLVNNRYAIAGLLCRLRQFKAKSENSSATDDDSMHWRAVATFKLIISTAIATLAVTREDFEDTESHGMYHRSSRFQEGEDPSEFPKKFLAVLDGALSFELADEALRLVAEAIPQPPSRGHEFWKHWKPLLGFIKGLIETAQRHKLFGDIRARITVFVKTVLENIAAKMTEQRPIKPTTWTRPSSVSCTCRFTPCQELRAFLLDSKAQTAKFKTTQNVRQHLENAIKDPKSYDLSTERYGTPHTFVVTKTTRGYPALFHKWKAQVMKLHRELEKLRTEYLKELLGDDYERLTSMGKYVHAEPEKEIPRPTPPVASTVQNGLNGSRSWHMNSTPAQYPAQLNQGMEIEPPVMTPRIAQLIKQGTNLTFRERQELNVYRQARLIYDRAQERALAQLRDEREQREARERELEYLRYEQAWAKETELAHLRYEQYWAQESPLTASHQHPTSQPYDTQGQDGGAESLQSMSPPTQNSNQLPPVIGVKRKASDFVDLTGNDFD